MTCDGPSLKTWSFSFLFFKKNFIYLFIFIFGCVGSSFLCEGFLQLRRCHSSSWCTGLSLSRPLLLRSTGSRRAGSVVVAHGLSCSAACGIFPGQGLNPCPLHWQADSQPLRHQGKPQTWSFSSKKKDLMKLALIATGRWASMGPGFAQVSEPGAWLSPLKLDRSPLGAPSPKISLERSQSPPQGLRIPPTDSRLPRLCLITCAADHWCSCGNQ